MLSNDFLEYGLDTKSCSEFQKNSAIAQVKTKSDNAIATLP